MGGLGHVDYAPVVIGDNHWAGVRVWTDHPAVSCMASQYAGWAIQVGKYFAMGSGPLRAHARVEKELFAKLGYAETARRGVLVLETRTAPTDDVAAWVRSEEHTSELQSLTNLVCRLLLEKKKKKKKHQILTHKMSDKKTDKI